LIEPKTTLNTGNVVDDKTAAHLGKIGGVPDPPRRWAAYPPARKGPLRPSRSGGKKSVTVPLRRLAGLAQAFLNNDRD
jgi:hypothetical protein